MEPVFRTKQSMVSSSVVTMQIKLRAVRFNSIRPLSVSTCHSLHSLVGVLLRVAFTSLSSSAFVSHPTIPASSFSSRLFTTENKHDRVSKWRSLSTTTDQKEKQTFPDYGKTTVQIDTIRLEERTRASAAWRRHDLFGSSIVNQTLEDIKINVDFQDTQRRIEKVGLEGMSREERKKRRRALDNLGIPSFSKFLRQQEQVQSMPPRKLPKVLQLNIGLYCNQACVHCHVESSPLRSEAMTAETAARCLELLKNTPSITTLDITGGAPELNPNFRFMVKMARFLRPDLKIIDRCNLTVLQEPGQEDLIEFLKEHEVHIIASLPCYSAKNVNTQRGKGVFERSIAALIALNDAGYSRDPNLQLDLVYNPLGAFLPPPQNKLEAQYKQRLEDDFGILFDHLYTITNMPIKRFADFLRRRGELEEYMELLVRNFNPDTVSQLMCLDTVSIGWDGRVSAKLILQFEISVR
jgi:radical SAM/Cys-rich protein